MNDKFDIANSDSWIWASNCRGYDNIGLYGEENFISSPMWVSPFYEENRAYMPTDMVGYAGAYPLDKYLPPYVAGAWNIPWAPPHIPPLPIQ
jgi:hypothetical protein